MPLTTYTVTLRTMLADAVTPREGTWYLTVNTVDGRLTDDAGNQVLSGVVEKVTAAGVATYTLPALPQSGVLPSGATYRLSFRPNDGGAPLEVASFGLTANKTLDDLIDAPTEVVVTPSLVTQAEAAATAAAGSAASAAFTVTTVQAALVELDTEKVSKATTTAGTVISDGDNHPVKFATPSGAHWQLNTQTSVVDTNDHLFRRVYNYDLTGSNKREIDDVAVREAFETNYQGVFEWNLDLHADNNTLDLTAPFRPLFYTYEWATGASRWVFTGQTFAQQNRDAISLIVAPYSNTQDAPAFAATKADGTTQFAYMSVKNGSYFGAPSASVAALTACGTTGQTARIFQALDAAGAEGVAVAANGELVSNNTVYFFGKTASTIPLRVQGKSGQTANLINVIDNAANPLFDITPEGRPWIRNGGRGILMHSLAGTKYEVTVSNAGALVVTAV